MTQQQGNKGGGGSGKKGGDGGWAEIVRELLKALSTGGPGFFESCSVRGICLIAILLSPCVCASALFTWGYIGKDAELFTYALPVLAVVMLIVGVVVWRWAGSIQDIEPFQHMFEDKPAPVTPKATIVAEDRPKPMIIEQEAMGIEMKDKNGETEA